MAFDDKYVDRFCENIMSSRRWMNNYKSKLDPYHAVLVNVCVNAVNIKKERETHPILNSIFHSEKAYQDKLISDNEKVEICRFNNKKSDIPVKEKLEKYIGDHDDGMPEVWCACCCKPVDTDTQAGSFGAWQDHTGHADRWLLYRTQENPMLSVPETHAKSALENHLSDYRSYVNRLCSGGWYTVNPLTTASSEGLSQPRLDHLFDKPVKKVLKEKVYRETQVSGEVPEWLHRLYHPQIKALWSDESDLESDSDHSSIEEHIMQPSLPWAPLPTYDIQPQTTESRASQWFSLKQSDKSPATSPLSEEEAGVPLMEWKCLGANRCLSGAQSALSSRATTASNVQCCVAQLPAHLLTSVSHQEQNRQDEIYNEIYYPDDLIAPLPHDYRCLGDYNYLDPLYGDNDMDQFTPPVSSCDVPYFTDQDFYRETLTTKPQDNQIPVQRSQTSSSHFRPVQILQRKCLPEQPKYKVDPEDFHSKALRMKTESQQDFTKSRFFTSLSGQHSQAQIGSVQSEPMLAVSNDLSPMPQMTKSGSTGTRLNHYVFSHKLENEVIGDAHFPRAKSERSTAAIGREKSSMNEGQAIPVQVSHPTSREIRMNQGSVSQWPAMWTMPAPTRSTFGSQVIQYNSMGRPMRMNISRQQSIRLTPSSYLLQQQLLQQHQKQGKLQQKQLSAVMPPRQSMNRAAQNDSTSQLYTVNNASRVFKAPTRPRSNLIQVPLTGNAEAKQNPEQVQYSVPGMGQNNYSTQNNLHNPMQYQGHSGYQELDYPNDNHALTGTVSPYQQAEALYEEAWPSLPDSRNKQGSPLPPINSQWAHQAPQQSLLSRRNMNTNNSNATQTNNPTLNPEQSSIPSTSTLCSDVTNTLVGRLRDIEENIKLIKLLCSTATKEEKQYMLSSIEAGNYSLDSAFD